MEDQDLFGDGTLPESDPPELSDLDVDDSEALDVRDLLTAAEQPGDGDSLLEGGHVDDLWWQDQQEDGLCVPTSVAIVASQVTGAWHDKDAVARIAADAGLLHGSPGAWTGMDAAEGEALLELLGVPADTLHDRTVDDIDRWLESGHEVIVGVDSDEVWYGVDDDADAGDQGADHALAVADVDRERGIVVLEDPGNPDGRGYEMTIAAFEDAWSDTSGECIVTGFEASTETAPETAPVPPVGPPSGEGGINPAPAAAIAAVATGFVIVPLIIRAARSKIRTRPAVA